MDNEKEEAGFLSQNLKGQPWLRIEGIGVVEPAGGKPVPFKSRWYRAWEAELYHQAVRGTGQNIWNLCRFGMNPERKLARSDYRQALEALREASRQALDSAGIRKGGRTSNMRLALVYFDFWGQTSYLERVHSWRDGFSLDIIPKDILRDHCIASFSCKIRGERKAFIEGLEVASDLLDTGEIDAVLVGGLFRFYPVLGFAEALENATAEKHWLGTPGIHDAVIVERAAFAVVTRGRHSMGKGMPKTSVAAKQVINISEPPLILIGSDSREKSLQRLGDAWETAACEPDATIYGGMYPSIQIARIESETAAGIAGGRRYVNICQCFGDSGSINPYMAIVKLLKQKLTMQTPTDIGVLAITGSSGDITILKLVKMRLSSKTRW